MDHVKLVKHEWDLLDEEQVEIKIEDYTLEMDSMDVLQFPLMKQEIVIADVDHGTNQFQCKHCFKNFTKKSNLYRHQKSHSAQKPIQCSHCGKSFTLISSLVRHQRIHTGEKLFQCSHCAMSCTSKTDFEKHQRRHTGEKPFKCSHCEKS